MSDRELNIEQSEMFLFSFITSYFRVERKEKMKKGDLFWSIAPDSESQGYGDEKPRKPWLGMVMVDPGRGSVKISQVSKETGIPDDDSNATAYVMPEHLYKNEEDAGLAYKEACKSYLRMMLIEVSNFLQESGIRDDRLADEVAIAAASI